MRSKLTTTFFSLLVGLAIAVPSYAQSQSERDKINAQAKLTAAEAALATAEAAGAPAYATVLFEEAKGRLDQARLHWNSDKRNLRNEATMRAVEATHAAGAAEALALLVRANTEMRQLRTELSTLGRTMAPLTLYDPPTTISRGATSIDRVIVAENAIKVARSAGADSVAPTILKHAEDTLQTARTIARNQKQSPTADHLSYSAEMMARRAEYVARRNNIEPLLPDLRAERARLKSAVESTRTAEVQQLRQQLDEASKTEEQYRIRLEQDRAARIAAEQNLDLVMRRYEATLSQSGASSAEVDQLRREVDEQRAALRSMQERERRSETSMGNQIGSLESALERERNEGRLTTEALARREEELRAQREELQRLQREREAAEQRRLEIESARVKIIEQLQQQVQQERTRATQTEAELAAAREEIARRDAAAREEIARRDAAARQRIEAMEAELAKLAATRRTERGLLVTLPGVFFDTGKTALKPGARNTLAKIADQLRINENTRITIEGHTDSVGSDALNQSLSEKRAAAVRDYIVSRGVPAARITTTGLGETSPVATNDTAAGRQQNRRVELIIAQ